MLDKDDFQEYPVLQTIVEKINKLLIKDKTDKVLKLIKDLEDQLEDSDLLVPITYILSVFAENYTELIEERLIEKIEPYFRSENDKLKINSIIIIGFYLLNNPNLIENYFDEFILLIANKSIDVRDNAHYFLQEFIKISPELLNTHSNSNITLEALSLEEKTENIISLLILLDHLNPKKFELTQIYKLRKILKSLILSFSKDKSTNVFFKIEEILNKFFPALKDVNVNYIKDYDLVKILENVFLMKKYKFLMRENVELRDLISKIKKSPLRKKIIYFYVKDKKTKIIFFYEFEKKKLMKYFDRKSSKISKQKLLEIFSEISENESDLKLFLGMLIKLGHVNGYLTNLGNFYPYDYLKTEIVNDFQRLGFVNLKKKFQFLPQEFVQEIILTTKQEFLLSKSGNSYYSLKKLQEKVSGIAAKMSSIDLKQFRDKLQEMDFIKLIKNLPEEYLTNFRKGTIWLTNIGQTKIWNEINNSRIIGFFDLYKVSNKLNINEILLMDVLEDRIDFRSGHWNRSKEIFYYSSYIKKKIEEINAIKDEDEKAKRIDIIADELDIEQEQILNRIDENYKSIGEEIKQQDQIKISEYIEKMGLDYETFLSYINDLEINYFKKGDLLILSPKKIEEVKNSIKLSLIENSKSMNKISLGSFDITSNLIENLINELKKDGKLKGIFYEEENELMFYTEKGIQKLMLDNSFLFSLEDLFYGKELSKEDIDFLYDIFKDLVNKKKLKGNFDEDTLTFSSDDVLFANDYNTNLYELEKRINNYVSKFNFEFQKIKKILTKSNETIYPQEIKLIQEAIDKINGIYVYWQAGLESFVNLANAKLLKDQGYSVRRFKSLEKSLEKKEDIKSFEKDPEVYDLLENFKRWVRLFNNIETKYQNVIFYQKRLINNPDDKESRKNLDDLIVNLNLV